VIDLGGSSIKNEFTTKLPSGNLLILCQAIDQGGSYANYTLKVEVTQNQAANFVDFIASI
jgi:hypothetical protein